MRLSYLIPLSCAALVAGSTLASAQGFRDDPPGWAFQKRGIIESNGGNPLNYRRGYGGYGYYDGWRDNGWRSYGYYGSPAPQRRYWQHYRHW